MALENEFTFCLSSYFGQVFIYEDSENQLEHLSNNLFCLKYIIHESWRLKHPSC